MNEQHLQTYIEYLKNLSALSNLDMVLFDRGRALVADFIKNSKHKMLRERRNALRQAFVTMVFERAASDIHYHGDESPVHVDPYYFQAISISIDGSRYFLCIGPFYIKEYISQMIEADLPMYSIESILGARILFDRIPGVMDSGSDEDEAYNNEQRMEAVQEKELNVQENSRLFATSHIRYNAKQEKNIRSAISNGDLAFVQKCCDENYYMETDHMLVSEPALIRAKHGIQSANSVYCRAAEDGGASSVLVRTTCANYSEQIIAAKTLEELIELRKEFSLFYCKKVKEAGQHEYSLHVRRCINWIEENLNEDITLSRAAEHCGISYDYLSRLIKKDCDCSFSELVHRTRCRFATYYLQDGMEVGRVSEKCGYKTNSQFCHAFRKIYGMAPGKWQNKNIQ